MPSAVKSFGCSNRMSTIALRYLSEPIAGLTTQDEVVTGGVTGGVELIPTPPPQPPKINNVDRLIEP